MKFDTIAQPWAEAPQSKARLPVKANHPFFLMHHPKNWELHIFKHTPKRKKGEETAPAPVVTPLWLPKLTKLIEKPGVNNVQNMGRSVSSSYAQSIFVERGFDILQHREHDYLRIYPAQGGKYYTHKFVDMELIGGELLRTTDIEAMATWRRDLVKNGHIDTPHPGIIRLIIKKMDNAVTRMKKRVTSPANQEELEQEEARLKFAYEALETLKKHGVKSYE